MGEDYQTFHNELALTFMFNYYKGPIYLTSLSVFIRQFEDELELNRKYYLYNDTLVENIGSKRYKGKDEANKYYVKINEIINQLSKIQCDEIKEENCSKISLPFYNSSSTCFLFDDFALCKDMLKKHVKHLAYYLAIHFKNHPEKFYD